jgi:hypothetical protein
MIIQRRQTALDAAIHAAYGFSPLKDVLKQLLDLNLEVAQHRTRHCADIPPDFPNPKSLITDDCIRPAN